MASVQLRRTLYSSLRSLHPVSREVNRHPHRLFSSSVRNNYQLVDLAVAGPIAVLDGIHSLGVPWYAAIPITAVAVRSTFVYFLSTKPIRRAARIRRMLVPLTAAHLIIPTTKVKAWLTQREPGRTMISHRISRTLGKSLGLKTNGWRRLINLGTVIAFAEAIRMKSGARDGLLKLLLTPLERLRNEAVSTEPSLSPDEIFVQKLLKAREKQLESSSSGSDSSAIADMSGDETYMVHLDSLNGPDTTSPYFDPTLQMEGLSWCTDLTLTDPTMTLPLAFSALFGLTILLQPRPELPNRIGPPSVLERFSLKHLTFAQRIGLCVAVLFSVSAPQMPASILLYFIPSIATGWLQSRYLDFKEPLPAPIQPCTRPISWRVKRR